MMKFKMFLLFIVLSCFYLQGQQQDTSLTNNELSFKLVSTERLDFPPQATFYDAPDKDGISYPFLFKIVEKAENGRYKNKILDKKGNYFFSDTIDCTYLQFSENRKYIGRHRLVKKATQDDKGTHAFCLYNRDVKLLVEDYYDTYYEADPWEYIISDNGYLLKKNNLAGDFILMDSIGHILSKKIFPVEKGFSRIRHFDVKFTEDNKNIIVLYEDNDINVRKKYSKVYYLNRNLDIVFEYDVDSSTIQDIFISPDKKHVLTSKIIHDGHFIKQKAVQIYNREKLDFFEIDDIIANHSAKFFNENELIIHESKKLLFFDIKGEKEVFLYNSKDRELYDYDYAPEIKRLFLFVRDWINGVHLKDFYVLIYDLSKPHPESPVSEKLIEYQDFVGVTYYKISCATKGNKFMLSMGNYIYTYQLED